MMFYAPCIQVLNIFCKFFAWSNLCKKCYFQRTQTNYHCCGSKLRIQKIFTNNLLLSTFYSNQKSVKLVGIEESQFKDIILLHEILHAGILDPNTYTYLVHVKWNFCQFSNYVKLISNNFPFCNLKSLNESLQ